MNTTTIPKASQASMTAFTSGAASLCHCCATIRAQHGSPPSVGRTPKAKMYPALPPAPVSFAPVASDCRHTLGARPRSPSKRAKLTSPISQRELCASFLAT
jgi:hypothetical protein